MLRDFRNHIVSSACTVKEALIRLDKLSLDAVLFIANENNRLLGSVTDGDIRRGLIKGLGMQSDLMAFANPQPKRIEKYNYDIHQIIAYREKSLNILPVVDNEDRVINMLNLREQRSYLPVDAVIMAGGRGERLRPLTDTIPKPLLKVGDKPILEHNLDRLRLFGIDDFWITVRYLGEQIESYFGNGHDRSIYIQYVYEKEALGTIGAVSKINSFTHNYILVTNSDLLTNIEYEHFFLDFIKSKADFSVVTVPYSVDIPYAVLETNNRQVLNFREKPTYTYYSNGGIYLMKREVLKQLPVDKHYNATDLMATLLKSGSKVISYPLTGYWLDIGRHDDYIRATKDINHIKF